jgi:hypothetical protein
MNPGDYINQQNQLPADLYSSDTGEPFSNCLMCDKFLLEEGTLYMIEKAFKQHHELKVREVIIEYAMCMTCATNMHNAMSTESRERINNYFANNADFTERGAMFSNETIPSFESLTSHCIIKKTPIADSPEFQMAVQCSGKNVLYGVLPFALSMHAMDEMMALMSAKSLGEIDDFLGKYFTGPPEVSAILKRRLILI